MARKGSIVDPDPRLTEIRAGAPRRSPSVRVLAAYATHADCNLATLGFAASVDFDRLLVGTPYEAPYGQSPFAFARGLAFERMIAQHGYASTLGLLRDKMSFATTDARIINLREGYPRNADGMRARAHETRRLVRQMIEGSPDAPNLIDGAVLEATIGGIRARFEADALAARFGGPIHAGEVKSFPVVDERADAEKLAAALDQVSVYILLTKRLVLDLGGDPDLVSNEAMLITPKNVGLSPTLSRKDVTKRIARVERLLTAIPEARSIAVSVPPNVNFGVAAARDEASERRVAALRAIADCIGTAYCPGCLATCGNALFCRERAFVAGAPSLVGPETARLLPGVRTLTRAADLTCRWP